MGRSTIKPTSITTTGFLDISGTITSGSHIIANTGNIKTLVGNIQSGGEAKAGTGINNIAGNIEALAGDVIAQNNITATTGTISAGSNVVATLGEIGATFDINSGANVTCSGGMGVGIVAVTGEVKSSGSIHAGNAITAVATIQAGNYITCLANNIGASAGNIVAGGTYPAGRVVADSNIVAGQAPTIGAGHLKTNTAGGELQLAQFTGTGTRVLNEATQEAGSGWYRHELSVNRALGGWGFIDVSIITPVNLSSNRMPQMEMEVNWLGETASLKTDPPSTMYPPVIVFYQYPSWTVVNVVSHTTWMINAAGGIAPGYQTGTAGTYLLYTGTQGSGGTPILESASNRQQKIRIRMGSSSGANANHNEPIELYYQSSWGTVSGDQLNYSHNLILLDNSSALWTQGVLRIVLPGLPTTPNSAFGWYAVPRAYVG